MIMLNKIQYHLFSRNIPTIFDKNNQFIYLCIEKNSQSSLIRGVLSERVISKKDNISLWLYYNDIQLIPRKVFCIIREPVERLLSTYFYFKKNSIISEKEDINYFIKKRINTKERKDEKQLHENFNVWDHHLNPQFQSILYDNIIVPNIIIPMNNNYNENMNMLLSSIGCNKKMIKKNVSSNDADKNMIREEITIESMSFLKKFYKKDFEIWDKFGVDGLGI